MSSNEEDYNDNEGPASHSKKRRIQRACDICRRKKIRCDGVQMPNNRCSNCIAYSFDCTYVEAAKKRGPPKGYVENLENRVEKLDKLLRRLVPDESVYKELTKSVDRDHWDFDGEALTVGASNHHVSQEPSSTCPSAIQIATNAFQNATNFPKNNQIKSDEDDETSLILSDTLRRMTLDPADYRFFGKSSGAMLINTALELRYMYTGTGPDNVPALALKRPSFWSLRPWERRKEGETGATTIYSFPEPDLAVELIDLYFASMNLYMPLLHRPTFEREVREGLHHKNDSFACVYLLVCAVGARFSDDPRVLLDGEESFHSCGWKWFDQVQMGRKSLLAPPTLHDLQFYCLCVQFLQGSSAPQSCWTMVGIGVRLGQDVGAHRRKVSQRALTPEDELWKRAFWILVGMDRMVSASLGRPCAIQDEDFDLDLPVDCDDEYWENGFKQPPNKPSKITHFILWLKLLQILAFCLRTIYSINKSKILLGFVGQQWEQHIVAELDSALNQWADSVADHLRWDPNREDETFFNQSVSLYIHYYHIQILIHRPFIPSPSKPSPLSFPSLAICTNAARSCSHVVDTQRRRNIPAAPHLLMATFTSGVVLLLSIWGGKRSGITTDPVKEMVDVHKCMQILKESEKRWHTAGRLWDVLYELAAVGELPLPQVSSPTNKRERDSETPISAANSESPQSVDMSDCGPRTIAGSKRLNKDVNARAGPSQPQHQQPMPNMQPQPQTFPPMPLASLHAQHQQPGSSPLASSSSSATRSSIDQTAEILHQVVNTAAPMYTDELGRMPLHDQATFSTPPHPYPQLQSSFWSYPSSNSCQTPDSASASISSSRSSSTSLQPVQHMGYEPHPQAQHTSHSASQPQLRENRSQLYSQTPEMSTMTQGYGLPPPSSSSFPGPGPSGIDLGDAAVASMVYSNPHSSFFDGIGPMDQPNLMAPQSLMAGTRSELDRTFIMSMDTQQQQQPAGVQPPPMTDGTDAAGSFEYTMDNDTIAMWSNAPTGFELEEWGTYLTNVSELTHQHGQQHAS